MRLETAHSTLRRTAAVKLQSHVRRYLTIKRCPRSGTTTPPQSYSAYSSVTSSQSHNGEVCNIMEYVLIYIVYNRRHYRDVAITL